jgi:hypothetical protein
VHDVTVVVDLELHG